MKNSICVILESGWIIKGIESTTEKEGLALEESSVVRRWDNGKGIGGIVKEANKDEYILDPIGDVIINNEKILFVIPCEW